MGGCPLDGDALRRKAVAFWDDRWGLLLSQACRLDKPVPRLAQERKSIFLFEPKAREWGPTSS